MDADGTEDEIGRPNIDRQSTVMCCEPRDKCQEKRDSSDQTSNVYVQC